MPYTPIAGLRRRVERADPPALTAGVADGGRPARLRPDRQRRAAMAGRRRAGAASRRSPRSARRVARACCAARTTGTAAEAIAAEHRGAPARRRRARRPRSLQLERADAVVVLRGVAGVEPEGERLQDRQQADVRAHEGRRARRVVQRALGELGDLGERRVGDRQRVTPCGGGRSSSRAPRAGAAGRRRGRSRACPRRSGRGGTERLLRRRGGDLGAHVEQHQQVAQVGGEERHLVGAGDQQLVGGRRSPRWRPRPPSARPCARCPRR